MVKYGLKFWSMVFIVVLFFFRFYRVVVWVGEGILFFWYVNVFLGDCYIFFIICVNM